MDRKAISFLAIILFAACSRLTALTPDQLRHAEEKWNSSKPGSYRLVLEMKGDRVEKEEFEVVVRDGSVASLRRNAEVVTPIQGQDYSMDGLFRMLHQELDLAGKPALLGAPEGYSAYPMAVFDEKTGRLIDYQRTVGGTTNTIEVKVLQFNPG